MTVAQSPISRSITFACPVHKIRLGQNFQCGDCGHNYPVINGVPVLINDKNSVFAIADYDLAQTAYEGASGYTGHLDKRRGFRQYYRRAIRRLLDTQPTKQAFGVADALKHVRLGNPDARVLVIGAGDTVLEGDVVYTDVAFGRNVHCIADAHDLPFESLSFDACFASAVLEHVADPTRCVHEIERVLKPRGYVFAETPFLQPVHMGAYDFTRFTYVGHRRLFRRFDEIASGMAGGPGTTAGQVLRYALTALTSRPLARKWLRLIGVLVTLPMRFLDRFMVKNEAAYDSASGFYFFGIKRDSPIPDRDIVRFYRGC